MAHSQRSLRLTDAYRARLIALANGVQAQAREHWPLIEELDDSPWAERMAAVVTRAQTEAVRATSGYLGAFLRSETGQGRTAEIDTRSYAGLARDGRPIDEALRSPLIGVRAALKTELSTKALKLGLVRATRMVEFETVQAARDALIDKIEADERFSGFERSVAGTCAACMALSGTSDIEVHPGCQCLPQPKVAGLRDLFPLPTGAALFRSLTKDEQEKAIGPEAAELVRDGKADLRDFVSHSKTETDQPNWITQRPVDQVAPATT